MGGSAAGIYFNICSNLDIVDTVFSSDFVNKFFNWLLRKAGVDFFGIGFGSSDFVGIINPALRSFFFFFFFDIANEQVCFGCCS